MTSTVEIPDGVRLWLRDARTNAAISAMATKPAVPDLSWEDYPVYVDAQLTAATVKAHHAILLHRVWQATWGVVLPTAGLSIPKRDWQGNLKNTTPDDVWNFCLTAQIHHGDKTYALSASTGIVSGHRCGILLGFFAHKDRYSWRHELKLASSNLWVWDKGSDAHWTQNDAAMIETEGADLSLLVDAAKEVAALIAKRC